jgi:hypothetical protein
VDEFLKALGAAGVALQKMSDAWQALDSADSDKVNMCQGWAEAFSCSVDDVPFILWGIHDELEEGGK